MENEWQITKQLEANWIKDRPIIKEENTLDRVGELVCGEAQELADAITLFMLAQTPENRKMVLSEASDVGAYLMAVFRLLEADMLTEIREKNALNSTRYHSADCQTGDWKQVYPKLKKQAEEAGLVSEFYL